MRLIQLIKKSRTLQPTSSPCRLTLEEFRTVTMPPTKTDLIYEECHGEHPTVELRLSFGFRRIFLWLMLVSAMIGHCALASEVLFLTRSNSGGAVDQVLRASRFYGLDVQIRAIDGSSNSKTIMRTLKDSNALVVIVSDDVL